MTNSPRVFVPALLSGLLLWLAYYPLNLGLLAHVALVPWLSLVRAEGVSTARRYLAAYVGGLAFFMPALQWIRVAHPMMYFAWFGMAFYCSLYWLFALYLLRRLDRLGRPPLALTLPVVWVALEYLRMHFPTGFRWLEPLGMFRLAGFGWYALGYSQHMFLPLIQSADIGGVYAVSVLVAAINGAVYEWSVRLPIIRRAWNWPPIRQIGFFREMWTAAFATTLLLGSVVYGTNQLLHPDLPRALRVAAIQADIPQDAKSQDEELLFKSYDELCITAAQRADLVIWPETCAPFRWYEIGPGGVERDLEFERRAKERRAEYLGRCQQVWKTNVLLGLSTVERDGAQNWLYNSAVLLRTDGTFDGPYHKMHLVPFGEYVPFKSTFPWLQNFTPYTHDYSCRPGEKFQRFSLNVGGQVYTFAVLICYEDSDPYLARQYVRATPDGEPPVDFLVNISNDGWFHGWEEHEQHLAVSRFRSIETRRPMIRAVNMGISAIIDSDGRIQALPGDSLRGSKQLTGTVTDRLKLDTRPSFYAHWGDWLPISFGVLILAGWMGSRWRS